MRAERERRVADFHRQLDREKDVYRQRLGEQETKAKEAERARSQGLFEFEKERARWQLERDTLACKVQELEESVEKLVLQKESLMKENTRMKVESKTSKSLLSRHGQQPSYSSGVFPATTVSGGGVQ